MWLNPTEICCKYKIHTKFQVFSTEKKKVKYLINKCLCWSPIKITCWIRRVSYFLNVPTRKCKIPRIAPICGSQSISTGQQCSGAESSHPPRSDDSPPPLLPGQLFSLSPPCSFSCLLPCYLFWSLLLCFLLLFSLYLPEIWNKEKGEGGERERERKKDDEAGSGPWISRCPSIFKIGSRENWKGDHHNFQQLLSSFSEGNVSNHHISLRRHMLLLQIPLSTATWICPPGQVTDLTVRLGTTWQSLDHDTEEQVTTLSLRQWILSPPGSFSLLSS